MSQASLIITGVAVLAIGVYLVYDNKSNNDPMFQIELKTKLCIQEGDLSPENCYTRAKAFVEEKQRVYKRFESND